MAVRYSYEMADPMAQYQYQQQVVFQSAPRRFFSAVGRFFYRLIVLTLVLGAIGGILFALYRNDVLLTIARGAGVEAQYRNLEKAVGAPGWGTPRSIVLPSETQSPTPAVASPSPASPENKDSAAKQPETVPAVATSEVKRSTADGLPIVSFDSLPTAPAKAEPATVSLNALPATEPAKAARAEPAQPRPSRHAKAEPAKPAELTRSIPLLKPKAEPKPEPVAKAAPPPPEPKPEPKVDRTAPRASDNPLKAAIRAAMIKSPKTE